VFNHRPMLAIVVVVSLERLIADRTAPVDDEEEEENDERCVECTNPIHPSIEITTE